MPEKEKGFSFRQLFFRDSATGTPGKQTQQAEPASNKIRMTLSQIKFLRHLPELRINLL